MEYPSMQRVPKPGGSIRAFSNFCMLASPGASSLTGQTPSVNTPDPHSVYLWDCCSPDEGDLVLVHPRLQLQAWVLSKRRHDEAEDERDADEHGREDNLKTRAALQHSQDRSGKEKQRDHRAEPT